MINIRRNLFETNSSSVHCMTLLNEKEMEAFDNGELWISFWGNKKLTNEEVEEIIKEACEGEIFTEEDRDDILDDKDLYNCDRFNDIEYYETFCDSYKVDGKTVYAIGYSGYSG